MVFLQIILGHISGRNLWCSASFPPTAGQQVLLSSNPEKITHKTRQQRCQCEATAPTVTTVTNAAPVLTLKLKDKKEDGLETPWRRPRNGLETAWRHPGGGGRGAWPEVPTAAGWLGRSRRSADHCQQVAPPPGEAPAACVTSCAFGQQHVAAAAGAPPLHRARSRARSQPRLSCLASPRTPRHCRGPAPSPGAEVHQVLSATSN